MKHKEITAMAKEAGFARHESGLVCILDGLPDPELRALERFAALVAAKEREACALVCDAKAHEVRLWCNESNVIACATAIRARGRP